MRLSPLHFTIEEEGVYVPKTRNDGRDYGGGGAPVARRLHLSGDHHYHGWRDVEHDEGGWRLFQAGARTGPEHCLREGRQDGASFPAARHGDRPGGTDRHHHRHAEEDLYRDDVRG